MSERDSWLTCDDAELLRQCSVDTYRASGPGGQKRNKTDSAVRLRHGPSGVIVIAEESRSQHENKARALMRLRAAIALEVRCTYYPGRPPPEVVTRCLASENPVSFGRRRPEYWPVMAILLDALATADGEMRKAGAWLGLSTARFSRLLTDEPKVMAAVNSYRRLRGFRPLTRG